MRLGKWTAAAAALAVAAGAATAQEPPGTDQPALAEGDEPTTGPEMQASIPFTGAATVTYRGVLVHVDWWIPIPEQWALTRPALLELRFSHSPVLIERLSSMTASVNDMAVDSVFLSIQNARDGKVVWEVPTEYLKPGDMNKVNLTAKMRSDLELCDDVHSPALWLVVEKDSRFVLRYREQAITPDVSKFPQSYLRPEFYYQPGEEEYTHAMFVIPTNPSTEVLEGMAVVAARVGVSTRYPRGMLGVWSVTNFTEDIRSRLSDQNLVVVGDTAFVKKLVAEGLDLTETTVLGSAPGTGHIVDTRNPWNPSRRALVVTGGDDDAVSKAVTALSLPRLSEEWAPRGDEPPSKGVHYDIRPTVPATDEHGQSGTYVLRMGDLGLSDRTARGKFSHHHEIAFPNPFVGRIKSPAFLRLFLSYSELLVPETSSMLVKVNGEPVRSVRLAPSTANRLEADVVIPEKFLGERVIVVNIEYFLDIGDPDCHYNFPEMAWVTLFADSFLAFPLTDAPTTSLRSYPWVAAKSPHLNGTVFVVADDPSDESLTAMVNVAAYLGKSLPRLRDQSGRLATQWVHPWLRRVSDLQDADVKQHDLLVLGDYDLVRKNPKIAQSVPGSLFSETPTQENLKTYSGASFRADSGWIHLAPSPWDGRRHLLVASGSKGGPVVSLAAEYLWMHRRVEQLGGSTVLVGPNGSMQILIPAPGEEVQTAPAEPLTPRVLATAAAKVAEPEHDKEAAAEPAGPIAAPAAPESRHQVAYLVFVILGLLLVVLVVVRIRDSMRSDRQAS